VSLRTVAFVVLWIAGCEWRQL